MDRTYILAVVGLGIAIGIIFIVGIEVFTANNQALINAVSQRGP